MKKRIAIILVAGFFYSFVSAAVIDDAISWMYDNELTSKGDQASFKPNQGLRRDEAAKFFVEFAILLGKTTYVKTDAQCKFSDINESRSDLKTTVVESCKLGLFQGSNGKFKPKNQLTNAQAIAVLVRLISGKETETGLSHRADNYYTRAKSLNLLGDVSMTNKNNLATRGSVGTIIYNGRGFQDTNIGTKSSTIGGESLKKEVNDANRKTALSQISTALGIYTLDYGFPTKELGKTGSGTQNQTIKNILQKGGMSNIPVDPADKSPTIFGLLSSGYVVIPISKGTVFSGYIVATEVELAESANWVEINSTPGAEFPENKNILDITLCTTVKEGTSNTNNTSACTYTAGSKDKLRKILLY